MAACLRRGVSAAALACGVRRATRSPLHASCMATRTAAPAAGDDATRGNAPRDTRRPSRDAAVPRTRRTTLRRGDHLLTLAARGEAAEEAPTRTNWPLLVGALGMSGAVMGTLLDGIHSRTGLQVYEALPFDAAGLHTSLAVPPLLAAFYVVLGCLFIAGDALALPAGDAATTAAVRRCADGRVVAAAYGVLALDLQLSAALYSGGTGFGYISAVLAAATAATWAAFDGTKQGAALAAFTALAAPASELVLLRLVPLWSYPRADVDFGEWGSFVSWVPWCYMFYSPALGALARWLYQTCRLPAASE